MLYIDTGSMYRAFGLAFLRAGADDSPEAIKTLLSKTDMALTSVDGGCRVSVNGDDVSDSIRTPEVSEVASKVAQIPEVPVPIVNGQFEQPHFLGNGGGA